MLGFINYYIVQWVFVRICRIGDSKDGQFKQTGWGILYLVWPGTGWGKPYKALGGKMKTKRIV